MMTAARFAELKAGATPINAQEDHEFIEQCRGEARRRAAKQAVATKRERYSEWPSRASKKYVVRVVIFPFQINDWVIKLLHAMNAAGSVIIHREDDDGFCFDIPCPPMIKESGEWAQVTATYMELLGFNAVKAPAT